MKKTLLAALIIVLAMSVVAVSYADITYSLLKITFSDSNVLGTGDSFTPDDPASTVDILFAFDDEMIILVGKNSDNEDEVTFWTVDNKWSMFGYLSYICGEFDYYDNLSSNGFGIYVKLNENDGYSAITNASDAKELKKAVDDLISSLK